MQRMLTQGFLDELEKIAKEPSWWEKQKGVTRAMSIGGKGISKIIAKPEVVKGRLEKGVKYEGIGIGAGAIPGAALGTLLSKGARGWGALVGAGAGAGLGYLIGSSIGTHKHDVGYLKKRGITSKYLGLSAKFSPAAKKKYIETPMTKR